METPLVTLVLVVAIIIGARTQECLIETRDDLPKDNQPLYLVDGKPYKQIEPTLKGNKSIIGVRAGASIILACNGEGNYLLTGGKAISKAVCDNGFSVESRPVGLKAVTCKSPVRPTVKETKNKCGHDGRGSFYQVGFQVEDSWMEVLRACHDLESASTLYVDHIVSRMVESGAVRDNDRPAFKEGHPSLYKGLSVTSLYRKKKQKEVLEAQLERGDYFKEKDSFLSKGHLAADADFVYSNNQYATYFYINTAPQWYSVNRGNWYTVEKKVKQLAAKRGVSLTIRTGTQGILKLEDSSGILREVYLDPGSGRLPVPALFWKAVVSPSKGEGIVFIVTNNPFFDRAGAPCKDVCSAAGWRFNRGQELGRVTCCSFQDAARSVIDLPKIKIRSLLSFA